MQSLNSIEINNTKLMLEIEQLKIQSREKVTQLDLVNQNLKGQLFSETKKIKNLENTIEQLNSHILSLNDIQSKNNNFIVDLQKQRNQSIDEVTRLEEVTQNLKEQLFSETEKSKNLENTIKMLNSQIQNLNDVLISNDEPVIETEQQKTQRKLNNNEYKLQDLNLEQDNLKLVNANSLQMLNILGDYCLNLKELLEMQKNLNLSTKLSMYVEELQSLQETVKDKDAQITNFQLQILGQNNLNRGLYKKLNRKFLEMMVKKAFKNKNQKEGDTGELFFCECSRFKKFDSEKDLLDSIPKNCFKILDLYIDKFGLFPDSYLQSFNQIIFSPITDNPVFHGPFVY